MEILRTMAAVSEVKENDGQVFFRFCRQPKPTRPEFCGELLARDVPVTELKLASENLEQLYFR